MYQDLYTSRKGANIKSSDSFQDLSTVADLSKLNEILQQDLQKALAKLSLSQKALSAAEAKADRNRAAFDHLAASYDSLILENQSLRKSYNEVCDEVDSLRHDLDYAYSRLHEMSVKLKENA